MLSASILFTLEAMRDRNLLRPPGAGPEHLFISRCIRCARCVEVCPYGSIKIARLLDGLSATGTPVIKPRGMPCYLCMKCPAVCPSGALDRRVRSRREVRMGIAQVKKQDCLAWQNTICRSCYQSCPIFDEAITLDGALRPVVDEKKCVGCGICEHVCPVEPSAITVKSGGRRWG